MPEWDAVLTTPRSITVTDQDGQPADITVTPRIKDRERHGERRPAPRPRGQHAAVARGRRGSLPRAWVTSAVGWPALPRLRGDRATGRGEPVRVLPRRETNGPHPSWGGGLLRACCNREPRGRPKRPKEPVTTISKSR